MADGDLKRKLVQFALDYAENSPLRKISPGEELSSECAGLTVFDLPIIGIASASDPLFSELKKPEVVGEDILLPDEWLPGARSVISFFMPASGEARDDNRARRDTPSFKWMQMTTEGSRLIKALGGALCGYIEELGYRAVMPVLDERFRGYRYVERRGDRHYMSAWSERHAAYIAGLGTFSLTRGLITRRGVAGRFGSVITDLELEPDIRGYSGLYDYCTMCGACVKRCPAGAITLDSGKRNEICAPFVDKLCAGFEPRNSCGKCQVGVPCEKRIPKK